MSAPELGRLSSLLNAADREILTLPERVFRARRAVAGLTAWRIEVPSEVQALDNAVDAAIDAAGAGTPIPRPTALLEASAARAEAGPIQMVRTQALDRADDELVTSIYACRDEILAEHARPALIELLGKAKAIAPKALGDGDRQALLNGPPTSITAWRELEKLAPTYRVLRDVQRALSYDVKLDVNAWFVEFRDGVRAMWPSAGLPSAGTPPWPTAPAARLKWLALSECEVWMPTPSERDAAWQHAYGEGPKEGPAGVGIVVQ